MANDGRGWLCLLFDEEEKKIVGALRTKMLSKI